MLAVCHLARRLAVVVGTEGWPRWWRSIAWVWLANCHDGHADGRGDDATPVRRFRGIYQPPSVEILVAAGLQPSPTYLLVARHIGRVLKILALLPGTIFLIPFFFGGGPGLLLAIAGTLLGSGSALARLVVIREMVVLVLLIYGAAAALAAAWAAVILAPEHLVGERWLRVLVPLGLMVGFVVGVTARIAYAGPIPSPCRRECCYQPRKLVDDPAAESDAAGVVCVLARTGLWT